MQQVKPIPPKDLEKIEEARNSLRALGEETIEAGKILGKLLQIPAVTETDHVENLMKEAGAKVDAVAQAVEDKAQKAAELSELDKKFSKLKEEFGSWLNDLDETVSSLSPLSSTSDGLKEQQKECSQLRDQYAEGAQPLEELERLSIAIAELETIPGSRSSSIPRNVFDLRSRYDQLGSQIDGRAQKINEQQKQAHQFEDKAAAVQQWIKEQRGKLANEFPLDLSADGVKSSKERLEHLQKENRAGQREVAMLEKAIEMEWEALQNQQEATRKKLEDAEKIVDGVNQLDRWLHGKQRLIDSVGAPSTDSHMAKGQRAQIDMLKIDTENERLNMEKLKDLAEKLGDSATNDGDKEIIQKQIDLLNDRWGSLNDGLEKKESNISRAAELGAEIAQINKEIKKKLGELEHEVDAVSRLPSTEINQQLSKLDELKRREGEVNELLEKLGEKVKKADEYAVDSTNQTEIAEGLLNAKTKTAELDKKIDSVKQAALSVKDQGDLLDRHVDGLLDSIQLLALDINNVNDLVKQFIDQEATLKNHLVGDEQGLAKAQEEAQGPDARHLKRGAENLCDDVRALSKKARNGLAAVQKKIDLRTKFDKLIDESTAFAEGKEAELEKDKEMINRERLQAKLSEPINPSICQLRSWERDSEGLIEKMRLIDLTLNEKRKEAENVKEKTIRLATRLNSLYSDLNDLDPIGRSLDELQKQNEQCDEMNAELNERESELNSIYDLWKSALNIQAVTPEQLATNQQHLDDMKRGNEKLAIVSRKSAQSEEDLKRIENESKAVIDDVNRLAEHDALKNENGLTDPKTRAEELRQLKDQLRPVSERADSVQAECKALIKTASPDADTKQLSSTLAEVSRAVDGINASIGAKQLALDAAVQQMGSYNDAQRDLQNWLEETEELDKETSVDGFRGMIGKLANIASNDDEKKVLSGKADEITNRYEDLLEGAQKAQARLRDTVDLAEKFTHELAPFEQWLQQVEKKNRSTRQRSD
ncbi:unnamed protein product, partial [Mesorhabditis belari]|uniref:Uncharacterized protein n=1 Tax=Mesorhabditis belari TaxID=2138241 RepID=A0AAF3J8M0_9BILA